jgi:hypothetical protein
MNIKKKMNFLINSFKIKYKLNIIFKSFEYKENVIKEYTLDNFIKKWKTVI